MKQTQVVQKTGDGDGSPKIAKDFWCNRIPTEELRRKMGIDGLCFRILKGNISFGTDIHGMRDEGWEIAKESEAVGSTLLSEAGKFEKNPGGKIYWGPLVCEISRIQHGMIISSGY